MTKKDKKHLVLLSLALVFGMIILNMVELFPVLKIKLAMAFENTYGREITNSEFFAEFWEKIRLQILPDMTLLWVLCFPVFILYRAIRNYPIIYKIIIHIAASFAFGFVRLYIIDCFDDYVGFYKASQIPTLFERKVGVIITLTTQKTLMYWPLLSVLIAYNFYSNLSKQKAKSMQLESMLNNAKLENLKMQLRPHFLFNSLNTISMMVRREKNEEAVKMISGLSNILRSTLAKENEQFVSLQEEIELIKDYLQIEKNRFSDKLDVEINIEEELMQAQVPNLLLQPIVENAMKYGVANNLGKSLIKIESVLKNNKLLITIFNSGSCLSNDFDINKTNGIGLKNTRERLQNLYATDCEFSINNYNDGVRASITIPFKTK